MLTAYPPISFRATAAEREQLAAACSTLGYTRSELIRRALATFLESQKTSQTAANSLAIEFVTSPTTAKQ